MKKAKKNSFFSVLIVSLLVIAVAFITVFYLKKSGIIGTQEVSSNGEYKASTSSSSTGGEIADKMPANSSNTVKGTMVQSDSKWITDAQYYQTNGTAQGTKVEIANKNKVSTVYAVSVGDGVVPVPQGFYYVGGNLATGVIISDNSADAYSGTDRSTHSYASTLKGNQFVWIPCAASDYKKTRWSAKENTVLWTRDVDDEGYEQCQKYGGFYIARYEAGVATFSSSGTLTNSVTFANSYTLNGAKGGSGSTYFWDGGDFSWGWQNKNFCARGNYPVENDYGTNYAKGNVVFKANSIPYYHADYYTGCEMARRLYSGNNYVYCGLVTGAQWDVMVNKINSATSADISSNSNWGNYYNQAFTSTGYGTVVNTRDNSSTSAFSKVTSKAASTYYLMTTGSSSSFLKYGLYDVAGNLWEWTKEPIHQTFITDTDAHKKLTYGYMRRGGSFNNASSDAPACYRAYNYVAHTHTDHRFSFHTLHQVGLATFPK